jgi:peptidoglycan/LPS O-acetylase OafA/YrhL
LANGLCTGALIAIAQREPSLWLALSRKTILLGISAGSILCFALFSALPTFRTASNSILFNSLGYSLISCFFFAALIFALTLTDGLGLTVLSWRPLRYLGRISYSFYLYHVAVFLLLSQRMHSATLLAFSGFVVTFTIASASWHVMESPILKNSRPASMARQAAFPLAAD